MSLRNLFSTVRKHSFKEITDVIIGLERICKSSVNNLICLHKFRFYSKLMTSAEIIKQLVMLYFREGSIEKGDSDSQGTLLRK